MAHDPSLAYADYFAAAAAAAGGGGVVTTLVPEVDAGEEDEDPHLYGGGGVQAQHHGELDMFGGVRGLMPGAMVAAASAAAAAAAHGKQATLADFVLAAEQAPLHHHNQAPLTSLSLHGPADAAQLALHQHQHQHQHLAAWPQQQGAWHLRGSRFLRPTQQLLQEFCSLPVETTSASNSKPPTKPASEDSGGGTSSSAPTPSPQIQAMDAADLQRLKAKLYAMLQEVERRYRRYREQMRAVSGSFEAVAGERAAAAYTRLASRTISKHFRSLRDGVAAQMQAVRRALGEKDADDGGQGTAVARGETTPRLRVLDQCLRQHRAYQAGVLESQPWRPQRGLPERAVSILRAWLFEHFLHPYPSDVDKHILARQTGLSRSQVSNWFINARVRLWKPMVEEMYAEEMKGDHPPPPQEGGNANNNSGNNNPSSVDCVAVVERKPTRAQLLVHDAGSLASVVSIGSRDHQHSSSINFGMMDHLDFGAYNDYHHTAAAGGPGFGAGGVSLTLGLQQQHDDDHPHGGVNVAFAAAPSAAHEFLFTAAGGEQQMVAGGGVHASHGHHVVQFSDGMEGDDGVQAASHYHRGLSAATGFQLLHDLAG